MGDQRHDHVTGFGPPPIAATADLDQPDRDRGDGYGGSARSGAAQAPDGYGRRGSAPITMTGTRLIDDGFACDARGEDP